MLASYRYSVHLFAELSVAWFNQISVPTKTPKLQVNNNMNSMFITCTPHYVSQTQLEIISRHGYSAVA